MPSAYTLYRAAVDDGHEQLARANSALAWSGLAAGLVIGFSLIARGMLRQHLPDAQWRPLVTHLGYTTGFLIVVLSRQQMVSENALAPVLVLMRRGDRKTFINVLRLWSVVFLANMVGTLLIALVMAHTPTFDDASKQAFRAIAAESVAPSFGVTLLRGIFAGWLISSMAWMLHGVVYSRFLVIVLATYLISLGHFSQVIAGAVDAFYAATTGTISWGKAIGGYIVPALVGNMIGGISLVAALGYAQAAPEAHER
jgi:formate/nitrite transporter FocA (FNT family)